MIAKEWYFGINSAFRSRDRYRRNLFWNSCFRADAETVVLCRLEGGEGSTADKDYSGHNLDFIADTDTEKYYSLLWVRTNGKCRAHTKGVVRQHAF